MARRERPRHEAAGEEPLRDGRGTLRRAEVDQHEVRDRRADRPAEPPQRLAQPGPLGLDAGQVVVEDRVVAERLGDERDRDRRDRSGRPERVQPGDHLGTGDREADPQAGQRIGLARRADDDEVRIGVAQAEQGRADEFGVGLVEDDDGCRAPGRARVLGEAREQRWRSRPRAPAARSGCSGCTARRPAAPCSVVAARTASMIEGPASRLAEPRDRDDRRPALLGQHAVHRVGRDRDDRPGRRAG